MKLTDLQEVARKAALPFRHSVIGGGAPRDAFCGAPIKDIDLFVDVRDMAREDFVESVSGLAKLLRGSYAVHAEGSVEGSHFDTYHITWSGPVVEVLAVQRCVFTDIHDYDFGLSQIQMTVAGLVYTPKFQTDMQQNTLTYTKAAPNDKSAQRLKRLMAKYPDRMPVNCGLL
jgi:hypothetical protein